MMRTLELTAWWLPLAVMVALGLPGSVAASESEEVQRIVVMAAISDDPQRYVEAMKPLADYMAARLAPHGVTAVEVLVAENRRQLIRLLLDGRVDWVTETAYSAAVLEHRANAEILLRKWKYGVPSYQSILFVRRDSGIESTAGLINRRVAFQHPGSTTGYFLPRTRLESSGLNLRELRSIREPARPGAVNYLFSGSEYNSAIWVHKGLVEAAALSNLDWQDESVVPPGIRDDLRIIYSSEPIPRALELVRRDLHPKVKRALKSVLLSAHSDPEAKEALRAYHMTLRFDELDQESLEALRQMRADLEALAPDPDRAGSAAP